MKAVIVDSDEKRGAQTGEMPDPEPRDDDLR
jgi:hypothetical protein